MTHIAISAASLSKWINGEILLTNFGGSVHLVGTDTRTLPENSCYFALLGERNDGHDFVDEAIRRGAKIVVVQRGNRPDWTRWAASGVDVVAVDDTTAGLGMLAKHWRRQWGGQAVVITGSNGKTTTKEYTAAALETSGDVLRTPGNWNNHIGLPLTIFGLQQQRYAVLEIGTNAPGEIATLADIAQPNVAILTNVAPAHLLGLGSIDGVATEKGALFRALPKDGTAIVNLDDPYVVKVAGDVAVHKITYGTAPHADIRILGVESPTLGNLVIHLSIAGKSITQQLNGLGVHLAHNAAAAVGAAMALGMDPEVAFGGIQHAQPAGHRLTLRHTIQGVHIIDDCYNANPGSMAASLAALANLPIGGRRIAVLGDMLELGETSPLLHRQLGAAVQKARVDVLVAVGQFANDVLDGAKAAGFTGRGYVVATNADALFITDDLKSGDCLFVKGSRGIALEKVVDAALRGIG